MILSYIVKENENGMLLKEFLRKHDISESSIKDIKQHGDLLINGNHQTVRFLLHTNDRVEIYFPKETTKIEPNEMELDIYYEDKYFLVINKPQGLPVIPTRRYPNHTLSNGLIAYYQKHHILATVHLVNRLDKDSQGLLLVAKDRHSHYLVTKNIKHIRRIYRCIVEGQLTGSGVIDQPIQKEANSVKRYIDPTGKPSITHYRVLKTKTNQSLVECRLETGRTHQIRVHMASLGHPLKGDDLYGSSFLPPYYLDSVLICFFHPYKKEYVEIKKAIFEK